MQSYLLHKSFPTWGRCQAFLHLQMHSYPSHKSFPQGEGVKLPLHFEIAIPLHKSFPTWGRSQAFLKFLPPEMQNYRSPHREVVLCLLTQSDPSPASPQNTTLPFPTNPLSSICREGFPPSKCKTPTSLSLQNISHLYFSCYFFIYLHFHTFFFFIISVKFSFLFLFQNLEFFNKVEKLFPSIWGE